MSSSLAHVIVVGNSKGGSGKSTVAMHLIVSLLRGGLRVGSIDLDAHQGTLTRYLDNRRAHIRAFGVDLPVPEHRALLPLADADVNERSLAATLDELRNTCDVVVIDTPGADTALSRAGHAYADTLITPLNDSFIDLDVLARVDPHTMRICGFSHYAAMVFEIKKRRAARDGGEIAWIVLRNRLSNLAARNKQVMAKLLIDLSKRLRFHVIDGLGERVVFRELFLSGLTLLDLDKNKNRVRVRLSHIAARRELGQLLDAIGAAQVAANSVGQL